MKSEHGDSVDSSRTTAFPMGIALGISIGTAIGVLTDNIGLWLSLGVAIGCGISLNGKSTLDGCGKSDKD